jgi:hypothetical protein
MWPVRGVVDLAAERLHSLDGGDVRVRQRADGQDHETRGHYFACVGADFPTQSVLVEDRIGDAGAECDVRPQVESVGDVVQVAKDLRLGGVLLAPVPLLLKLLVKGIRVVHAFDIASRAGVAVPVPDSADTVRGLEHPDGQAGTAQPVQRVQAGEAGPYHHHVDVPGHAADGTGSTAAGAAIVPLCGNCRP